MLQRGSTFVVLLLAIAALPAMAQLRLLAPNGGEQWFVGDWYNIRWYDLDTNSIKIELIYNPPERVVVADRVPNTGGYPTYSWNVGDTPSRTCFVVVSHADWPANQDISDNSFTIVRRPNVLSPNGGETWREGSRQNISWMSSGVPYSSVAIELSTDGGANFNMVAPYESDDGSYAWEVPYTPTTRGRIKVNSISFNTEDASDADFTIGSASVAEDEEQQRELFALECSPTHFARHPFIRYSLEQECDVALRVYNPAGRVVTTLVCGRQRPGRYSVRWDVGNAPTAKLPAGTYFCRLEAGDYTATRKMVKTD